MTKTGNNRGKSLLALAKAASHRGGQCQGFENVTWTMLDGQDDDDVSFSTLDSDDGVVVRYGQGKIVAGNSDDLVDTDSDGEDTRIDPTPEEVRRMVARVETQTSPNIKMLLETIPNRTKNTSVKRRLLRRGILKGFWRWGGVTSNCSEFSFLISRSKNITPIVDEQLSKWSPSLPAQVSVALSNEQLLIPWLTFAFRLSC